MRYRQLGQSGLTVSVVGLGCNNFGSRCDAQQSRQVIDAALEAGITLFDTADMYGNRGGSESILGEALEGRREGVVLATKFGADMGNGETARASRRALHRALEASLRRLRTDHVDLLQLHGLDGLTPMEETLAALDEVVRQGKVRYIGSSNFSAWQVVEAEFIARRDHRERFISAQNELSLLERDAERELLPACTRYGIGVLPYFPLANGLLTGKYRRGRPAPHGTRLTRRPEALTAADFDTIERLETVARDMGHTLLEVAIAALASRPAVASVIAGATRPDQVRANALAADWDMTPEEIAAVDAALRPIRL